MGVDAAAEFGKVNFAMNQGLKALMVLGLVLGLAAPGIGAFGGALFRRHLGGLVGLFVGYVTALTLGFWTVAQMTRCRPGECHHHDPIPLMQQIAGFAGWLVEAYSVSWPWHLAWIGFGLVCLGAGLWARQRRDAARAARTGGAITA